jgi:hypothetical protein
MGRAARAKARRHALGVDNAGNRVRMIVAHGEAVTALAGDLRIQEHFQHWAQAMDQLQRDGPPDWMSPETPIDRVIAAIERGEIDYLADVLRPMGVPWRWCAEALIRVVFPILLHNARHPDDLKILSIETRWALGLPRGQAPPHDGRELAENVRWWYRAKVKCPKDSIRSLAEEYAERENRVTDARSVVQIGIERAENLLNSTIPR